MAATSVDIQRLNELLAGLPDQLMGVFFVCLTFTFFYNMVK